MMDDTAPRPEGAIGYLWRRYNAGYDSDPTPAQLASMGMTWQQHARQRWEGEWKRVPITKITAKRVFIRAQRWTGDTQQMSFDRAELEREGKVHPGHWSSPSYYTDAGKEQAWRDWAERNAPSDEPLMDYPLLGLRAGFTRRDVLRSYRSKAHHLHPDHGGDAEAFRNLTAEKDRALRLAA
jgi:hypothetical protein